MLQQLPTSIEPAIIYPDSDGQPMADNTEQFKWIVVIKENLEIIFAVQADVFVAGDLLWYPVEGNNKLRQAPDVMVAFGRPKGKRGSYRQWLEDNIAPQVVFEILSPGNTLKEMAKKLRFYDRHGVEEYYLFDPNTLDLTGWLRSESGLDVIEEIDGWVSPRLQIRFELTPDTLNIYRPDGRKFLTSVELEQRAEQAEQQAEQAQQQAELERQQAELERQQKEQAQARIQILEAQLRALGIDPNSVV